MPKLVVLDLFCGEGGAAWGYHLAGFRVIGVDLNNHFTNPQAVRTFNDKLGPAGHEAHDDDWENGIKRFADKADLIHASPPCQEYSTARGGRSSADHPDLIRKVREALQETGKPFVIENVKGAKNRLNRPVMLCGCMSEFDLQVKMKTPRDPGKRLPVQPVFGEDTRGNGKKGIYRDCQEPDKAGSADKGLGKCHWYGDCGHGNERIYRLRRERFFEASWDLVQPVHDPGEHRRYPAIPVTNGNPSSFYYVNGSVPVPLWAKRQVMGCDWMTSKGVAEAIPPAFTRYIGEQFSRQQVSNNEAWKKACA